MISSNPRSWAAVILLSVASAAGIVSFAQPPPGRPKMTLPTEDRKAASDPSEEASWDKRWVEFGALPSGKTGVIIHQDGQLPIEIVFETTKDQKLRAVRLVNGPRGELIKQPLEGQSIKVRMLEKRMVPTVSLIPVDLPDMEIPRLNDDAAARPRRPVPQ